MEQQFNQPQTTIGNTVNSNIKPKAPIGVKIIAWLMLLGGIGSLFIVMPYLIVNIFLAIVQLLIATGLIVTSIGLHKMKKWALYMYTVITVIGAGSTLYLFFSSIDREITDFVTIGIEILVLIYLWSISKKFV
jgi:hypothetical protein